MAKFSLKCKLKIRNYGQKHFGRKSYFQMKIIILVQNWNFDQTKVFNRVQMFVRLCISEPHNLTEVWTQLKKRRHHYRNSMLEQT